MSKQSLQESPTRKATALALVAGAVAHPLLGALTNAGAVRAKATAAGLAIRASRAVSTAAKAAKP